MKAEGPHVVMGSHAQAGNISAQGSVQHGVSDGQLARLADELHELRIAMRAASEPEETQRDIELGPVAQAEKAARQGNSAEALMYLKSAGKWCLDVATKIGVSLATEAIKQSTGLGK